MHAQQQEQPSSSSTALAAITLRPNHKNVWMKFLDPIQGVLVYREFVYRDPRNTGIFLMNTINLEYRDFPGKIRIP